MAGTPNARTTTTAYDPTFSEPTAVTDPKGKKTTYGYDSKGELTSITDPLNHKTVMAYANGNGQLTSVTDPAGDITTYGYQLGDMTSVTDPNGHTTTQFLDGAGRRVSTTDPLGNTTTYGFDPLNDLTSITQPDGQQTTYTYDPDQNLASIKDADGNTTTYTYDNEDRLSTKKDGMGNLWTYGYDTDGNLTSITDPKGQTTTNQYDALSRLTFAGYTASGGTNYQSTIGYTYDNGNRLTQAADSTGGTFNQAWDGFNELTQESGPNGTIAYTYDADGNRLTTAVTGQPQVSYGYSDAGRLTSVSAGGQSVAMSYDKAGRLSATTLPDGITETYTYDPASQITGIAYAHGSTTVGNLAYAYDPVGNRTAEWGSYASLTIPQAFGPALYNADNALASSGGTSYSYDADGNQTSNGASTYTWNVRGQLTGISGPVNASFTYDPLGRREQSTIAGTTTGYLYDGDNVIQELSGGTPKVNYLLGPGLGERYSRTDSTGTDSYLTDALGSTIALASSTGTVQTNYTYDPFGQATTTGTASSNPYQYAGQANDGTGLSYDLARYYNPATTQFISQDPLGQAGSGANLYQYADDNPVNLTDPTGQQATKSLAGYLGQISGIIVPFLIPEWAGVELFFGGFKLLDVVDFMLSHLVTEGSDAEFALEVFDYAYADYQILGVLYNALGGGTYTIVADGGGSGARSYTVIVISGGHETKHRVHCDRGIDPDGKCRKA